MNSEEFNSIAKAAIERTPWAGSLPWRHLLEEMVRAASRSTTEEWQFKDRLESGFAVVEELVYALNVDAFVRDDLSNLKSWKHRSFQQLIGSDGPIPSIVKQNVETAVALYIELPFRSDLFDRLLLDIAMAFEISAFANEMSRAGISGKFPLGAWALSLAVQVLMGAGIAGGIVLLFSGKWAFLVGMAVVGLTIISVGWCLLVLPFRYQRFRRAKQQVSRINEAMYSAYVTLDGSVTSINQVQARVKNSEAVGVVWLAPMYVLMEDVSARRAYI